MNKKTFVLGGLMIAAAITSCNKAGETEVAEDAPAKEIKAGNSYKIAFVQIDTLTSQYQKCKDLEEVFAKKRANAESTINEKGKSFTNQMQEFQRKYQSNQFTQQQFESEQARLSKLQQDLQGLEARLSASLQEEYQKEFQALTDTIQSFTKTYAKQKGYDFILCKSSGIDNVLYANEAYDVTTEVVNALNKRYKKEAPKAEPKMEEKK